LRKATISFVMSVRTYAGMELLLSNRLTSTKFYVWKIFENSSIKFKFRQNMARIMGTLHEVLCTLWYLAEISVKCEIFQTIVVEKIQTHILYPLNFPPKILPFVKWCGKIWKSRTSHGWEFIIRRMRFACWISKASDIHSKFVILLDFSRELWLRECASMLRLYTDIGCLVKYRHNRTKFHLVATGWHRKVRRLWPLGEGQ
jgi:hypothetical protein